MTLIVDPAPTPMLRQRRSAQAFPALSALALLLATAASAQTLNVSALVTGSAQNPPLIAFGSVPQACGASCQYAVMSSTGASSSYDITPGPYTASAWPLVYGANLPGIGSVSETLAVTAPPAGTVQDGGSIGVLRRAAVQFNTLPLLNGIQRMSVQTWKDGSGASTVSVTIRITPTVAKAHYLAFTVPKIERGWQEAYYVGGPSGYQTFSKLPTQLQTRSAVDVYADGLPIWSASSSKLRPRRWSPPYNAYLDVQWGPLLTESDNEVKFYLGTLSAGVTRTVALVFRTDQRVNADTCYTDTEYSTTYQRCDSRREALSLPAALVSSGGGPYVYLSYKPDVRVYTY